eukprot:768670-Rhodomonas_salina.1
MPNEVLRGADTAPADPSLTADDDQVATDLPGTLLDCVNEVLQYGNMPHSWRGVRTSLLLKKYPVTEMSHWCPVCLLQTAYKVASAIINDLLQACLFEQHGILEQQQEGNQQQHNTTRQIHRLLHVIQDARQTGSKLYVLYLELVNAYNVTNLLALMVVLLQFGIPEADVCMLEKLLAGSWLRVANSEALVRRHSAVRVCVMASNKEMSPPRSSSLHLSICYSARCKTLAQDMIVTHPRDWTLNSLSRTGRLWTTPSARPSQLEPCKLLWIVWRHSAHHDGHDGQAYMSMYRSSRSQPTTLGLECHWKQMVS